MPMRHPATFYRELSDDHLRVIATELLDLRFTTLRHMNSAYDDNYTKETAVFGRSKNLLIDLSRSGKYDWLTLKHAGMDVTFNIGQVPCRFFRDDPDAPEKAGFFKRNAVDDLFSIDENDPVMWRFVVEKALSDEDEDRVFFVGYNAYQEKVSEWMYRSSTPMLHAVGDEIPAATEIPPASVGVREDEINIQNPDTKTGSNE